MTHPTETKREIRIDPETKRYVIPAGDDGWTCWGFDNCFDETLQLAERLSQPLPKEEDRGTMAVYNYHRELVNYVAKNKTDLGTWFNRKTDPKVKAILEAARIEGLKVRIFYGETDESKPDCGRSWMEEHDVYGRIGRSMGFLKVPLMICPGEDGGAALLDHCIVKIIGTSMAVTLYEHPKFHMPELTMRRCDDVDGYNSEVLADGQVHARFKKVAQAERWVKFMKGERITP